MLIVYEKYKGISPKGETWLKLRINSEELRQSAQRYAQVLKKSIKSLTL